MNKHLHNPAPLNSENASPVLVDHQVRLMTGLRDYSIAKLKYNVVALANATKEFGLPIVATTTSAKTPWGPAFPEVAEVLDGQGFIDRTTVNTCIEPTLC